MATWADNYEGYDTDGWELLVEIMEGLDIADAETDYEKVYAIANWIGANVSYGGPNFPYLVLTEGKGLCGGYASLFCIMCAYAGVSAVEVTCSQTDHGWNAVEVDGDWYWADLTSFTSVEDVMSLSNGAPAFLYGNDSERVLDYGTYLEQAIYTGSAVCDLISDHSYYYSNSSCGENGHTWTYEGKSGNGYRYGCGLCIDSYRCTECGCYKTVVEDLEGHNYETFTVDPTCTSDGYTYYVCSTCGEYYIENYYTYKFDIVDALGHDETGADDLIVTKEPTCTASGTGYTYCTRCGVKITRTTIPATGHSWDDGVVTKEATATTAGVITYTCETCGTTKTETIPATGMDLANADITLEYDSCTYDGTAKTPAVTVGCSGTVLTEGTDYTTAYSDNKNAGTATVTVTGKGSCTGTATKTFTIKQASVTVTASISSSTIEAGDSATITASAVRSTGSSTSAIYYSSSDTSVATVTSGGKVTGVSEGTATITVYTKEYTNFSAGYAYITVTVTETDPEKTDLSGATVTLGTKSYTYDGTAKTPSVTVKLDGITLTKGTDYTVSYSNNVNAGTATVTVTGTGNYTGTAATTFTIAKASQVITLSASGTTVTAGKTLTLSAFVSTGNAVTYASSNTSVATVSSSGVVTGVSAGTATITASVAGTSNYLAASASVTITVKAAASSATDISGAVVTLGTKSYTYDGTAKKPSVTVTLDGMTLVSGTDYTVSYSGNVNAGTATVTVTGTGDYTGTATATFTIAKAAQVVSLSADSTALKVDGTLSLTGSVSTGNTIVYTSSNTSVATVDGSGVVTGISAGTVTITAYVAATANYNAASASVTLTVKPASASITDIANVTSGIKLTWNQAAGANGYYVYRKVSGGSYELAKAVTSGSTISYTDTSVKNNSGKTYTYYVIPYFKNSGGVITKGSFVNTKTIMRLSSAKVSSLTNTSSGITVKWGKVIGANGYYVYRKVSGGSYSLVKTITSGSTVSYSDTGVKSKNGTTYVYYVIPYYKNSSGTITKGSYSNTKTTVRLTAVSISSLTNSSSKKMTVKWGKNSKATGYQIQYSTSSTFSSYSTVTVSSASTVSRVISSLTKGKTYYVRVRAGIQDRKRHEVLLRME